MDNKEPPPKQGSIITTTAIGERVKRDEWSEGAVTSLLEAYERKWVVRNRAKLKGQDWEEVAKHVSSRSSNNKSPKTQTQCKNKIESMKKRYRSESASSASTWPLYSRLHLLLRGAGVDNQTVFVSPEKDLLLHQSNGVVDHVVLPKQEDEAINKNAHSDHESDKNNNIENNIIINNNDETNNIINNNNNIETNINNNNNSTENNIDALDSNSSTPALYSDKSDKPPRKKTPSKLENSFGIRNKMKMKKKKRRERTWEVAESVRWLAEAVVKSERARSEAARDIEKMRAESEAKRAEMDLKRTEIIAKTQLEIARIFAGITSSTSGNGNGNKPVDSSLRIGRN